MTLSPSKSALKLLISHLTRTTVTFWVNDLTTIIIKLTYCPTENWLKCGKMLIIDKNHAKRLKTYSSQNQTIDRLAYGTKLIKKGIHEWNLQISSYNNLRSCQIGLLADEVK